jgi:hypothetical protein
MSNYEMADAGSAIDTLRSSLGLVADSQLQTQFEAGLHPNLLSYEKIQASEISLPILEKYLIGASTYLHQPCNYYDIFRVCRCVNMVLFLSDAVTILAGKHVRGLEARLERLVRETEHDTFDSVAFELITAARYAEHSDVSHVEFIKESDKLTPDLLVRFNNVDSFVECKKINRTQNHSILIRDVVRDCLNPVIADFRSKGISFLGNVAFNCDPKEVSQKQLADAMKASFNSRTAIIEPGFTVTANPLPRYEGESYTLYPSPFFYWNRYRFRLRSEWFGLVHQIFGSFTRPADLPANLRGGRSTWLNKIDWDSAVKWKISSDEVVAKYRRFAFGGVFKGLEQIQDRGQNSCVHLWLETDHFVGSRKNAFFDLFNRIASKQKDVFGWLIINETLFDISPKGYFDLIEHAHMISGPMAVGSHPLVSGIFAPDDLASTNEFGIGQELPDIDE